MNKILIGITGHKGSGRYTWSFLLGGILRYLHANPKATNNELESIYNDLAVYLKDKNFKNVELNDSMNASKKLINTIDVVHHKFINTMISDLAMFLSCTTEQIENKNKYVIDMNDLSFVEITDENKNYIEKYCFKNWKDYKVELINKPFKYVSIANFLTYYTNIFKLSYGNDIWVKNLERSISYENKFLCDLGTKDFSIEIWNDLREPCELEFIKKNHGVSLYLSRPKYATHEAFKTKIDKNDCDIRILSNTNELNNIKIKVIKTAKKIWQIQH